MNARLTSADGVAQIVYEFLLRYVVSNDTDAKTAKKYIDQYFVVRPCLSSTAFLISCDGTAETWNPGC